MELVGGVDGMCRLDWAGWGWWVGVDGVGSVGLDLRRLESNGRVATQSADFF